MKGLPNAAFAEEPSVPPATRTNELRDAVCSATIAECMKLRDRGLQSIVLTGSLARKEATFVRIGGEWNVLGDAEFFLVFTVHAALPSEACVQATRAAVEAELGRRGIRCEIGLSQVHPQYLRRLPRDIFSYELLTCGEVIWGDEKILSIIRPFAASEIVREDAWRLLCNRLIELLECAAEMPADDSAALLRINYRAVKLSLDMATSLLVFVGAYAPTYRERLENLRRLANNGAFPADLAIDSRHFVEQVAQCVRIKLATDIGEPKTPSGTWQEAIPMAHSLWRWELAQLTGMDQKSPGDEIFRRWMRKQAIRERIRGWVYVLRARGWHRSWREWPRWLKLGLRASPRNWIYRAAYRLMFEVPGMLASSANLPTGNLDCVAVSNWLPASNSVSPEQETLSWRTLASLIVANYKEFLVGTRS
ncbi:MAG TPA: hypothetical protein VNE63_04875 [Candidatus Acidoferrales bacterium]|nr:hypothetical protein [Candidatus Acidoferrales bacterium]